MRGYRVSLSIVLQTVSQLAMRYGQHKADAIQAAFSTNISLSA
ncbi:MAG: hypothetical protein D3903_06865 [Candidatus Electrothrix sp. GM3_4]|nr:hypothetical protein [Candidatus Electrothrix sp. GM3_4]